MQGKKSRAGRKKSLPGLRGLILAIIILIDFAEMRSVWS